MYGVSDYLLYDNEQTSGKIKIKIKCMAVRNCQSSQTVVSYRNKFPRVFALLKWQLIGKLVLISFNLTGFTSYCLLLS